MHDLLVRCPDRRSPPARPTNTARSGSSSFPSVGDSASTGFSSTIACLIVRDQAHENAFAKALETLGVNWGCGAANPQDECRAIPRGQEAPRHGSAEHPVHRQLRRPKPGRQALPCITVERRYRAQHCGHARRFPMIIASERREEFSPGLGKEHVGAHPSHRRGRDGGQRRGSQVNADGWADVNDVTHPCTTAWQCSILQGISAQSF